MHAGFERSFGEDGRPDSTRQSWDGMVDGARLASERIGMQLAFVMSVSVWDSAHGRNRCSVYRCLYAPVLWNAPPTSVLKH